jgi:hypothetical protein
MSALGLMRLGKTRISISRYDLGSSQSLRLEDHLF